jgi:hypothetical protein
MASVAAAQFRQPVLERGKAGTELGQGSAQGCGGHQPLPRTLEQLHPQPRLGPAQMLADGAKGHAQLLGRRRQCTATRHDLDRAHRIEGNGKALAHGDFL